MSTACNTLGSSGIAPAPRNLRVNRTSPTTFVFTWDAPANPGPAGPISGYSIVASGIGNNVSAFTAFTSPTVRTYTLDVLSNTIGLKADGTIKTIRVTSTNRCSIGNSIGINITLPSLGQAALQALAVRGINPADTTVYKNQSCMNFTYGGGTLNVPCEVIGSRNWYIMYASNWVNGAYYGPGTMLATLLRLGMNPDQIINTCNFFLNAINGIGETNKNHILSQYQPFADFIDGLQKIRDYGIDNFAGESSSRLLDRVQRDAEIEHCVQFYGQFDNMDMVMEKCYGF
jgi:hypothetical protein